MPDAHVGYGLPIGGVLATDNAVIPYAVGVDIACRMKMTVLDLPVRTLADDPARLTRALERETRFGIGADVQDAAPARRHGRRLARERRHRADEGSRVGAARHERQRQSLRRVRHAHRHSTRPSASRAASISRCSATRAAAAPARRSRSTTASSRASSIRSCRRSSRSSRGSISPARRARNTGRRWS